MILAITQARMSSTRLPGKVLMEINGKTLLDLHIDRVKKSSYINKHVIAISESENDNVLEEYCKAKKIDYFRGSENDVLDRFYSLSKKIKPASIVRLTADCPLIDSLVIDQAIDLFISSNCDYASNTLQPSFPDGLDTEVFSYAALEKAWKEATLKSDREHVTAYIWKNSTLKGGTLFSSANLSFEKDFSNYRLTVDEKEDFLLIEKLIKSLGEKKPWLEYINYIEKNKLEINTKFLRNEGYSNSLKKD
ncbi:MAG: biosynthesis protein [Segetibacter sp.]|nr:biosynthesis protein [Segetibacter sp.]